MNESVRLGRIAAVGEGASWSLLVVVVPVARFASGHRRHHEHA